MAGKQVVVRQVWASNLKSEFFHIQKVIRQYPFVSMDTEFPGTIFQSTLNKHLLCYAPDYTYYLMKLNVDMLKIIQLGLTFSDLEGNLPTLGTEYCYCWQFNFRDFDLQSDPHNVESIRLLEKQGTNFKMHREKGIDSRDFAKLVLSSGLIFNYSFTWITFHGAYDLAFFIKILTQQELPRDLQSFMGLMKFYLGVAVYDIKYITSVHGLHGGLERVSKLLGVNRIAGNSHQAGPDSLLTLQTLIEFKNIHRKKLNENFSGFEGMLSGLCGGERLLYKPDFMDPFNWQRKNVMCST
ncbi:hypothetical protein P3X46_001079 [Hevea brasiliensis]|uniref:poly(A)-specific ribonuclease n=2 Tax=Hevea brasiliensis TaxID=3981 RepID=A0ABQ9NBL8_HEVBR|nr:probable CCR4-associated factor 1 homolog 11 [Hevea brasiliensis]KAJ9189827.1 hypothetical protein P3X46_001079 [Hevea brasiliensis]